MDDDQNDVFDDLSWEYGEKEVDVHGFWKLGLSKTVNANQVAKSILAGTDETGCYPLFLQPTSGRPSSLALSSTASDFLGHESHLRASGNGPNKQLRLIPFMAVMRPGTLTYIKQRLHDPQLLTSVTAAEVAKAAAERRDLWLAGGPWLPPDFLATWYGQSVHDVSLGGVTWPAYGQGLPYDRIVTFEDPQLPESVQTALEKAHATLVRERMTLNQFRVAAIWWAHYVVKPELHKDFGSEVPAAQVPKLMNFAVQIMVILRGTEEYGLAFFPNLARAAKARHDAESTVADSSQAALEQSLVHWFTIHELKVTGHLLPGDLLGTRNARFPSQELDASLVFRAQTAQHRTHTDSVRSVVTWLGDVRDIYRQRCRFDDKLRRVTRFTCMISRTEAEENDTTFFQMFPDDLQMQARRQAQLSNNIDMVYTGMHMNSSTSDVVGRANRPTNEVNLWLETLSNTNKGLATTQQKAPGPSNTNTGSVTTQSIGVQTEHDKRHQVLAELWHAEFSQKRETLLAEFNRRVDNLITETQTIRTVVRNSLSPRSRSNTMAGIIVAKRIVRERGNNLVRDLGELQQHLSTLLDELPQPPEQLRVAAALYTEGHHQEQARRRHLWKGLQEKARTYVSKVRDRFNAAEENVKNFAATLLPWVSPRNGLRDSAVEDMVNEFTHQSVTQLTELRDKIVGDMSDMTAATEHTNEESHDMPSLTSRDAVREFARQELNMIPVSEVENYAANQLGMLSSNEALQFAIESGFEPPEGFDM
ncbi:hypothetical protein EV127DRAFT_484317 [Xylaria flabelliformis]|nr:hypothetical protein EV127DRAFT_484317 [Xylaria flabelliformis]